MPQSLRQLLQCKSANRTTTALPNSATTICITTTLPTMQCDQFWQNFDLLANCKFSVLMSTRPKFWTNFGNNCCIPIGKFWKQYLAIWSHWSYSATATTAPFLFNFLRQEKKSIWKWNRKVVFYFKIREENADLDRGWWRPSRPRPFVYLANPFVGKNDFFAKPF